MEPILSIRNLTTRFLLEDRELHAVNGIDITVRQGETLAIVGESGSGKSVSFLSILGLIPMPPGEITDGEVHFNGLDLLKLSRRELCKIRGKDIAMIFQDPMTSLNPVMRIGEQLGESLILHLNYTKKRARKKAVELLETVGISDAEKRIFDYPHQFSGGMRQRVMIAMALACEHKIIIADEPTTALDVTIQAQIIRLVKKLQSERGMSVIWISHDLGIVASIADSVAVMYAGKVVESGRVDDIFANPRHPYTFGLLKSTPRLDQEIPEQLEEIPGSSFVCHNSPSHCAFASRCQMAIEKCFNHIPTISKTDLPHTQSACFRWQDISRNEGI
jgi:oligopeptide transport system ATP-binding protein